MNDFAFSIAGFFVSSTMSVYGLQSNEPLLGTVEGLPLYFQSNLDV